MSVTYHAVHWNSQKRAYDAVILLLVIASLATFTSVTLALHPGATAETLIMRGTAFTALFLLQVLLCIGPLARLSTRFMPLLYNRRHLGIIIFLCGLIHALVALIQHHALGDTLPFVSVISSYAFEIQEALARPANIHNIPFEPFGAIALIVLFLMAATSHDFWLKLLGPSTWKCIHMLVYPAYAALLIHISLGFFQSELHYVYPLFAYTGFFLVVSLHLLAAWKGAGVATSAPSDSESDGFLEVCPLDDLVEGRGKAVELAGQRLALFRHDGQIVAVSGVCRHQGGPIAEGRIIDGCITCPWHGWQYRPEDGESPPPFDEHLPTYPVEIREGKVYVNPTAHPRRKACGTAIPENTGAGGTAEDTPFYVGYQKTPPQPLRALMNATAVFLLVASPLLMAAFAAAQSGFDYGRFEFGEQYRLEGTYYADPLPTLYVTPGWPESREGGYNLLLCAPGKFGLPPEWSEAAGKRVQLKGTPIYRDETTMLEVSATELPVIIGDASDARPPTERVGPVSLTGELVDTKCYLGVMRPATGKVHRACAIRCLSGGIPPSILVQSEDRTSAILLTGPEGKSLAYDVTLAGLKVQVHGTLFRENGFSFVRVDELVRADTGSLQ